jgi:hypothetical protein
MLTLTELKERVIQEYDPDLLLEVLEITTEELLERFEDKFIENIESFEELT